MKVYNNTKIGRFLEDLFNLYLGAIQQLCGQDGGQKMSVFVHSQGIKTVHAGWGQKMANVHVVVEWPLRRSRDAIMFNNFVYV